MKIKFVKGHVVKGDSVGQPVYKEGDVVEFKGFVPESYANKYVARGLAVVYVEPAKKVEPKPAPVAAVMAPDEVAPVVEPVPAKFTFKNKFK